MINFFFPDITTRSDEPELMDRLDSNEEKLIRTVEQFKLLNFLFTCSRSLMKTYFYTDMMRCPGEKYTLLDIGAGGCDLALRFLQFTKKKKITLRLTCLDSDPRIITYARQKCQNFPEIEILQSSAHDLAQLPDFDYIFANHFLHHLSFNDIRKIIPQIYRKTKKAFLLNDLKRSRISYAGYTIFTGLFLHNSFLFNDGRLSIKKGFTYKELETIVENFSNPNIAILKKIPSRLILYCQK